MILALEFSTDRRSLAIRNPADGGILASIEESSVRGISAASVVARLLQAAEIAASQVDSAIVGLGPGSYTGIRSALALMVGWNLGSAIPVYGLSTHTLLAWQAWNAGARGEITIASDAHRAEFYAQTFTCGEEGVFAKGPITILNLPSLLEYPQQSVMGPGLSTSIPKAVEMLPSAAILASLIHLAALPPVDSWHEPLYIRETTFVKIHKAERVPLDL